MPAVFARLGDRLAAALAAAAMLASAVPATAEVAADDPRLVRRMEEVCRAQAIASGGLDAGTADFCRCIAPIFARHLTPAARTSFVEQDRAPDGPIYDDERAVFDEVVASCPQIRTP
jgi:hypothetical protein